MRQEGIQPGREPINRLSEAVERIAAQQDRDGILRAAATGIAEILQADAVIISAWYPERREIVPELVHTPRGWSPPPEWQTPRPDSDHPLFRRVHSLRRSLQYHRGGMSIPRGVAALMEGAGIRTWISFPLLGAGQAPLGIIDILDARTSRMVHQDEIDQAAILSRVAAAAYQRALLIAQGEERAHQLSVLLKIIAEISTDLEYPQSMQLIARPFADVAGVELCLISLLDPAQNRLELLSAYDAMNGTRLHDFPTQRLLAAFPPLRRVLETRSPAHLSIDDSDLDPSERDILQAVGFQAVLVLPLVRDETAIGLIELYHSSQGKIHEPAEQELLQVLAASTLRAITHSRLHALQRQKSLFSTALVEASRALNSSLNFTEVLEKILDQTMLVMNCRSANIMLIEEQFARVVGHKGYEDKPAALRQIFNMALPLTTHTLKRMLETHKPVIVEDTVSDPEWTVLEGDEWIGSFAGAPLMVGDEVIGFLNLDSDVRGFFSPEETQALEAFASIAASVLRNAQRHKNVQDRAYELEIVRKATLSLTASLDLQDVLLTILRQSLDLFAGPRNGHIFLYQNKVLSFGAGMRGDGMRDEMWAAPRENGLTYTVARTGHPIIVDDMRKHPLYKDAPADWTGSIIGLPLKYGDVIVGVMNIAHQSTYQFKDYQIRILSLLADQAAISIVNARLHNLVQEQSLTDPLTGLNNRRALTRRLEEEVQRAERYNRPFSLSMIDLNGFKKINDTYGHPTGDTVLVKIGQCLKRNVRNTDFLARFGGDEFALIMPETPKDAVDPLVSRLKTALEECDYDLPDTTALPITISIGTAEFPEDGATTDELIAAADFDLYRAKKVWREGVSS